MSACRYCRAEIVWRPIAGRPAPHNADGSVHRCLTRFSAPQIGVGSARSTSNHEVGKTIRGALYQPSCGECDVPPWESCSCSKFLGVPA